SPTASPPSRAWTGSSPSRTGGSTRSAAPPSSPPPAGSTPSCSPSRAPGTGSPSRSSTSPPEHADQHHQDHQLHKGLGDHGRGRERGRQREREREDHEGVPRRTGEGDSAGLGGLQA